MGGDDFFRWETLGVHTINMETDTAVNVTRRQNQLDGVNKILEAAGGFADKRLFTQTYVTASSNIIDIRTNVDIQ